MSKAIAGAAMLGGAFAMGAAFAIDPALINPFTIKLLDSLVVGGISMEAGAIAQALTQQRGMNITTRQPASYRQIIYGTQRVGGVIIYQSTTGSHYDQYNFVIVLASHECYAIENLYLDGRRVYWQEGSGGNSTRNGYNFGGSANGTDYIGPNGQHYNFGTLVYCEARYGDQSDGDVIGGLTANDPHWAASGGQAPWVGGCTYVYLKVEYDSSMFPQLPEIRFTVHGKANIQDPRTGTPGFSANPALIINDIFTDPIWNLQDATVNQAQLIAAANVCDELVACAPTTGEPSGSLEEAQYVAHWHCDTSTPAGEAIKVFLAAMGGRLTRTGGEWTIWPAYWQGPSAQFDQNALVAAPRWTPYRRPDELINRVNGTYVAPNYPYNVAGDLYDANGWYDGAIQNNFPFAFQPTNFPQYAADTLHGYPSDQYLTEDGNIQLPLELELKAVLSVAQAQRLAKIALMRNRQQGSGVLKMKPVAFATQGIDVIEMTFPQLGWNGYILEVAGEPQLSLEGGDDGKAPYFVVTVPVQDTSSAVYEWSPAEELTVYDVPSSPAQAPWTVGAPTSMTLVSGANTAIVGADGIVTPRVLVEWTDPLDVLVTQIQIQFRGTGGSSWQDGGTVAVGLGQAFVLGVVSGQAYDFQIRALRANGATSAWVQILDYTVSLILSIATYTGIAQAQGALTAIALSDGTAEIIVANFYALYGTVSVGCTPSPNVLTGLAQNTQYWVYYIDPNFSGGTITPIATTSTADFLGKPGYILIGSVLTPTYQTVYRPSAWNDIGNQATQFPAAAYDGSEGTDAIVGAQWFMRSAEAVKTTGNCLWSGFPSITTTADMTLTIKVTPVVPSGNTSGTSVDMQIVLFNGGTQTKLAEYTANEDEQTITADIPSGTNLANITVQGVANITPPGGASSGGGSCSLEAWEIGIQ